MATYQYTTASFSYTAIKDFAMFSAAVPIVGYGIWQVLAGFVFPLVILKIPINILILIRGCTNITEVDMKERSNK